MKRWTMIAILILNAVTPVAAQDKYTGPEPPKKNIPYIVHADTLIETEGKTAIQSTKKDQTTYTIAGDKSTARTPLASPLFVVEADTIDPQKLQLFRLEVKNGHREVTFHTKSKGGAMPLTLDISKIAGTLFQLRVVDSLDRGQYSLSPDGTNDVFCFAVF